jgi:hypothetical protein
MVYFLVFLFAYDCFVCRELEGVVRDLQESLLKRHPDSVASLIRAASVSDSVQLQRRQQEQQVEQLRQEVEDSKVAQENKLRSLRQEHERMKLQYEKVVANLEQQIKSQPAPTHTLLGGISKISSSSIHNIKNLSQAIDRIR